MMASPAPSTVVTPFTSSSSATAGSHTMSPMSLVLPMTPVTASSLSSRPGGAVVGSDLSADVDARTHAGAYGREGSPSRVEFSRRTKVGIFLGIR
jgi:hypothetical protein